MPSFPMYEEIHKDKVESLIQARFAPEIRAVRALGFNEEFYIRVVDFPLSAALAFPMLLYLQLRGAVLRVNGLLQSMYYNPYLIHEEGYAHALVSKRFGVRYATMFEDGTLLHSQVSRWIGVARAERHYIRQVPYHGDLARTWQAHIRAVQRLTDEGREATSLIHMHDIVRLERYTDALLNNLNLNRDEWIKKKL